MAKMDSQGLGDFFYNVQNVVQYGNLLKKKHPTDWNKYVYIDSIFS
jgi:hypothetical protein